MNDKTLPHFIEAEQCLLGALLVNSKLYDDVSFLRPEYFFYPEHGEIYARIELLSNRGDTASPQAVAALFNDDAFQAVGGAKTYITGLAANVINTVNAAQYARLIYATYTRRGMIEASERIRDMANDNELDMDAERMIAEAEQMFFELSPEGGMTEVADMQAGLADAMAFIQAARNGDTGVKSNIAELDGCLKGFRAGEVSVIGARPSMGKTALGLSIALNMAYKQAPVMFFSLEMPKAQLFQRLLARVSGIPTDRQMEGVTDEEQARLEQAVQKIKGLPLYTEDTGALSLADVISRTRRAKRKHNIQCVVIDYLGLMRGNMRIQNKVHQIEEITNGLKAMAKSLKVHVILLHQLSRGVEGRDDKRPQLSDLRDSGAIEQDADIVMFLYREEYYLERESGKSTKKSKYKKRDEDYDEEADHAAQLAAARGKAEIIVAKNRMGKLKTVRVKFDGGRQVFENE